MSRFNNTSKYQMIDTPEGRPTLSAIIYNHFFIAFKLLSRSGTSHRKRNKDYLLCIVTIALSVLILIITSSVINGFREAIENGLLSSFGHGTIRQFYGRKIDNPDMVIRVLKSNKGIEAFTPYMMEDALIEKRNHFEYVKTIGVSIEQYCDVVDFRRYLIESDTAVGDSAVSRRGRRLASLFIGSGIARVLGLNIGDEVVLAALNQIRNQNYTPAMKRFVVAGIYRVGIYEFDYFTCIIALAQSQKLFNVNGPEGFWVRTADHTRAGAILDSIKGQLGGYPWFTRDYRENNATLFRWIAFQNRISILVLSLILIVAVSTCLTLLLMISFERWNELGILRCLGTSKQSLFMYTIIQGLIIGLCGSIAGIVLSIITSAIVNRFSLLKVPDALFSVHTIYLTINIFHALLLSFITTVSTVATSMIPAFLSLRISPAAIIRPQR